MSYPRIYQVVDLSVGSEVGLDAGASHHLSRVLRAETGESIQLFNGDGQQYLATLISISKKEIRVAIKHAIVPDNESPVRLTLVQGVAKGEKMDWIIQKAVELGVSAIFPLITERCNVRLSAEREAKRLLHWQAVVISACEQSGRCILPKVHAPQTVADYLQHVSKSHANIYILSPHHKGQLSDNVTTEHTVMIGPEGGFTDDEVVQALSQGCKPLNLGPRILRTETAAISALTVLQAKFGDLG